MNYEVSNFPFFLFYQILPSLYFIINLVIRNSEFVILNS
jgi:hypothetical protein